MVMIFMCASCSDVVSTFRTADIIAISNILVTSSIGLWIGLSVRKNFTINRAVKEYFISECQEIRKMYSDFLNCLYKGTKSSKTSIEWFKLMSIKIGIFEEFLTYEFKVSPSVLHMHNNIKQFITDTDEFNEHYSDPNFTLSSDSKRKILEQHEAFSKELTKVVININKSNKKHHWYSDKKP
jgi:hypothetical protein